MSKITINVSFTPTEEQIEELIAMQRIDPQSHEVGILNAKVHCDLNNISPESFLGAIEDIVSVNGFLSMFITKAEEETE